MHENDMHLDVYSDRSELCSRGSKTVFKEGCQSKETIQRVNKITQAFEKGFYAKVMHDLPNAATSNELPDGQSNIITTLVSGITSEFGRALVGLACLQLAIKSIAPEQSIRLHKGSNSNSRFSWQEGISMRMLDNKFNTPFLREYGLLKLNKDGIMMTRSLAENYPYSYLYKAEMRGPIKQWITMIEAVEARTLPPRPALNLLLSLLKNHSDIFTKNIEQIICLAKTSTLDFKGITKLLTEFFTDTTYSARAFEVVIHAFMQAYSEMGFTNDNILVPLSQMRSANKKHGNIGDIELKNGNQIIESWDAKYGKPYLRDELEELNDKLEYHPDIEIAGFIVNVPVDSSKEIVDRAKNISAVYNCKILLLSFSEWVKEKTEGLSIIKLNELGRRWILAAAESFGQKRPANAPIDEPCDLWLYDLKRLLMHYRI